MGFALARDVAKILIADDDASARELFRHHLEQTGHALLFCETGEEALRVASVEGPDLVVLDLLMPGMDGAEAARRLKEESATFLPIIIVTGLDDLPARLRGLGAGADDFLTKPVDRHELKLRIGNLLALRAKEVALASRNVELMELHRFRDEMSSLVVHDLKNPMSVVIASLDFIAQRLPAGDPELAEAVRDCQMSSRRILRIAGNLLDLARLESGRVELRREPIQVAELIESVASPRIALARSRNITLTVQAEGDLRVLGDTDLLTRVVENVLDNSLRYAPAGGRVLVLADLVDRRVRIRFGNNGPPVPHDARRLIFEKYGQTTRETGRMNLGLGLYFCRLAVEAHGGRIYVADEPLPAVFGVELPI